ncbi:hypothetical protein SEA_MACH_82 [Mycobacterium phage MaCh]|nr:hypothetical protein SEA_MACH_82 [Mycobacterium phage MaCh]
MMLRLYKDCDGCGADQERVFEDSWTGLELCNDCIAEVIEEVTFSPQSEGDNLKDLLRGKGLTECEEEW